MDDQYKWLHVTKNSKLPKNQTQNRIVIKDGQLKHIYVQRAVHVGGVPKFLNLVNLSKFSISSFTDHSDYSDNFLTNRTQTKTIHIFLSVNLINSDALNRIRYPPFCFWFVVCGSSQLQFFFIITLEAAFNQSSTHNIKVRIAN